MGQLDDTAAAQSGEPGRRAGGLAVRGGALGAALLVLAIAAPARGAPLPVALSPWNGVNPFSCTVQDAGLGTHVPDPAADPYCVRFDKTHQNVTQLGIVDFLLNEPARVAAAVPKCFYYQEDHWRGSIVQGGPALYEFTGHYFFDKARGDGGAWVTGLSVLGHTLGSGTYGWRTHDDVPADPRCRGH